MKFDRLQASLPITCNELYVHETAEITRCARFTWQNACTNLHIDLPIGFLHDSVCYILVSLDHKFLPPPLSAAVRSLEGPYIHGQCSNYVRLIKFSHLFSFEA